VTPSSSKKAPSDGVIHSPKSGAKGGRKRHKQHPQGATTMIDHDNGNCGKAGNSSMGHIATVAHGDRCQVRPSTDHFRRLLEKACSNHAYPIKHKLKNYDMMKSFMISESFTRGMELDKDPSGSDTKPFPGEETVMMVLVDASRWRGIACLNCAPGP
jgi:hypothetical protein